jgi:hypothetical protein
MLTGVNAVPIGVRDGTSWRRIYIYTSHVSQRQHLDHIASGFCLSRFLCSQLHRHLIKFKRTPIITNRFRPNLEPAGFAKPLQPPVATEFVNLLCARFLLAEDKYQYKFIPTLLLFQLGPPAIIQHQHFNAKTQSLQLYTSNFFTLAIT